MLYKDIEELNLEDDNAPPMQKINSHIPLNVPLLLQSSFNKMFLTDTGGDKVASQINALGTKQLFRFCSVYDASKVAIQSLSSGNFLDLNARKFSNQTVSRVNALQIQIENKALHFLLNSDTKKCLDFKSGTIELSHMDFPGSGWRFIFPIPPLSKTLDCNIFVPSSTSILNKLPYNIPVHLQSFKRGYLGFDMHTAKAWSILTGESIFNEVIIRWVSEGKVAFEARKLRTFLHVYPTGKCAFIGKRIEEAESFSFSFDSDFHVNFFSCFNSKALRYDVLGDMCCEQDSPGESGKWKIQLLPEFDIPLIKSETVFGLNFYYD